MIWLYRLQQRLSITRHEGLAVLTLASLFLLGLTVRHVQEQQLPPVAVDSLVVQSEGTPVQTTAAPQQSSPDPSAENPLNVNTASQQALKSLPGIGPALSKRIEAYRTSQGDFERATELQRVSGIGPKTLATLRPMIQVRPSAASSQ